MWIQVLILTLSFIVITDCRLMTMNDKWNEIYALNASVGLLTFSSLFSSQEMAKGHLFCLFYRRFCFLLVKKLFILKF